MTRRFRAFTPGNEQQLERWLNAMADRPEEIRENSPWRHQASRQLKIEAIQFVNEDGVAYILAVISRLEDDDES